MVPRNSGNTPTWKKFKHHYGKNVCSMAKVSWPIWVDCFPIADSVSSSIPNGCSAHQRIWDHGVWGPSVFHILSWRACSSFPTADFIIATTQWVKPCCASATSATSGGRSSMVVAVGPGLNVGSSRRRCSCVYAARHFVFYFIIITNKIPYF